MIGKYPIGSDPIAALRAADRLAVGNPIDTLFADRFALRIHAIRVAPLDPVTFVPVDFFWADRDFLTPPDDTPANRLFEGRVLQVFSYQQQLPRELFLGSGVATASAGEIRVAIGDGALDQYLDHVWEGQPVTVYVWAGRLDQVRDLRFSDFQVLATALIQTKPEADRNEMTLRLRDPRELLDRPITTETYAGTGGLEGPAELKGTTKPKAYGHLTGVAPILLDAPNLPGGANNLLYQWSASSVLAVTAVYDKGVALAFDPGAINTAVPWNALGKYRVDLTNGTIQLGGKPDGQVTLDGHGKAIGTPVEVLRAMLEDLAPNIPLATGTFVKESRPGAIRGYAWVTSTETWADLVPKLLSGQGSVLVPNRLGQMTVLTLRLGQTPTATITEDVIASEGVAILTTPNPSWRLRFQYRHNWTPIDVNASAGVLDPVAKANLARPYLEVAESDATIKTHFPLAEDPEPVPAYVTAFNGAELNRLFALVSEPRRLYRIPMYGRPFAMTLGQPVLLLPSRPLVHEKRGAILTIDEDAQTNAVTVEVLV